MDRRSFFLSSGIGLASYFTFSTAPAGTSPIPKSLRLTRRYSYRTDSWTVVRMRQLRKGDAFELGELGVFLASSDPYRTPDGTDWEILCSYKIDPKTNRWEPLSDA